MARKARQPGRPTKAAQAGEKSTLPLRVTSDLKRHLDEAGQRSGRNLSQEAELRLEFSFRDAQILDQAFEILYGRQAAGLFLTMALAAAEAGRLALFVGGHPSSDLASWPRQGWAFDQAARAAQAVIDALRPGPPIPPTQLQSGYDNPGYDIAKDVIRSITRGDTEWAARRRDQLGDLVKPVSEATRGG